MLSIGKIALGQHRYYEQQVAQGADDYYSGRGEAAGEWVGAGAEALGLEGKVCGEDFSALLAGLHPRKRATRLRSSERDPKVAALDLTFSAPKSVSVLAAVGEAKLARQLIVAHEEAVRAALAYLEDSAVQVRRGHLGKRVQRGAGLIAAAYRHRMSRALDPQLHTHVVAANMTRGRDGRYTALHGSALYRAAKTAGYLYQSHLRALITQRLGPQWGPVHKGAAELTLVPERVLALFSRRRHEMERAAAEGGFALDTKTSAQAAALATRDRKQYGVDTHTWREEVRARAGEHGLGTRELKTLLALGARRVAVRYELDEASVGDQLAGPDGLTEKANTFDDRAVLQAFAQASSQGVCVWDAQAQAERFAARSDVIQLGGKLTSAELIACERQLIASAIARRDERCGIVDPRHTRAALTAAPWPLNAEQAAAVRAITSTGAGVSVIEALAGTGKTYIAGILRDVYERAGHEVIGAAPTARAARELQEQADVTSCTLERRLRELEQLGGELPRKCVVILDEAGMAPTRASARLLSACESAGAKVIAIGDPGQLPAVQAGGWLRVVGERLGSLRMREVSRQRDPVERRALRALRERQPERYLEWADRAGRIQTFKERTAACEAAIDQWRAAVEKAGLAQAVMVARDNETRAHLNDAARELGRALGLLGATRSYGTIELAIGDRVICRRNDSLLDVDNGARGTVRHADERWVVIETDAGLERELPASYVQQHVEHAYALTGHGMQGATVEQAIVLASPRDLTAGWSYTALSRARGETRLLIHDHEHVAERSDFAPGEQTRGGCVDLLMRVALHMGERDDEDLAIEQLPSSGRALDEQLAQARALAWEIH